MEALRSLQLPRLNNYIPVPVPVPWSFFEIMLKGGSLVSLKRVYLFMFLGLLVKSFGTIIQASLEVKKIPAGYYFGDPL